MFTAATAEGMSELFFTSGSSVLQKSSRQLLRASLTFAYGKTYSCQISSGTSEESSHAEVAKARSAATLSEVNFGPANLLESLCP